MTDEDPPTTEPETESPLAGDDFDLAERPYGIYRCVDCRNVVLTMQDCGDGMTCHGEPMKPVTAAEMDVKPPDLRQVLLDAFGLPKAGLDICLCVIGDGPLAAAEVAEELDYDSSTVSTYLNTLVDLGLLEQSQLNRASGGFVNVYDSVDLDRMRRETLVGFYVWAGEAAALIEQANLTKAEYRAESSGEPLQDVFWEAFDERR
ncbi:helix-turn-helix domain-containing protein [Halobacteriales archaeon Cl-PHB]